MNRLTELKRHTEDTKERLRIKIRISYETYKGILEFKRDMPGWFIIGFMFFLISAAIQLAQGMEHIANKLAELAYYCLVIGVLRRLIQVIKENRRNNKTS